MSDVLTGPALSARITQCRAILGQSDDPLARCYAEMPDAVQSAWLAVATGNAYSVAPAYVRLSQSERNALRNAICKAGRWRDRLLAVSADSVI